MKRSGIYICAILLVPFLSFSQPGSSCASPIPITMDSISRSYTISASTGSNVVCSSLGTSPITYFSLVANSSGQNMILRITGPNTGWVEVAFYDGTSCTNGYLETASSICFYDGTGLWAPSENFVITPNKTYILRIKTAATGTGSRAVSACFWRSSPAYKRPHLSQSGLGLSRHASRLRLSRRWSLADATI